MVVGKILQIDQVVDDLHVIDPVVPNVKESLPFASRINQELTVEEWKPTIALMHKYSGCYAKTRHEH